MNRERLVKYVAVAAAALLCVGTRASAQLVVTVGADDSTFLADASGNWLAPGDLIEVGGLNVSQPTIQGLSVGGTLTAASYATLLADFVPLNVSGTAVVNNDYPNSGDFASGFEGSNTAFINQPVIMMVFNQATTNLIAGVTQVGVFVGEQGIGAQSWTYPNSMASGNLTIDTDYATNALIGAFNPASSVDNPFNDAPAGGQYATLGALETETVGVVPEPSSIVLVGMGLLGLLAFRRRS